MPTSKSTHKITHTSSQISVRTMLIIFSLFGAAFCVLLLSLRKILVGNSDYDWLLVNIALAWLPLVFAFLIKPRQRQEINALFFIFWLIFLPNAGYGFTDLWHLSDTPTQVMWLDILMLFVFGMNSLFVSSISIDMVHDFLRSKFSVAQSWALISFFIALTSIGIYMGRFLRLNSWDLFFHPFGIVLETFDRYLNPIAHPVALPFSILLTIMLLGNYVVVRFLTRLKPN